MISGEVVGTLPTTLSPEFVVVSFKWIPTTGQVVLLRDLEAPLPVRPATSTEVGLIIGDAVDSNNAYVHAVRMAHPHVGRRWIPVSGRRSPPPPG